MKYNDPFFAYNKNNTCKSIDDSLLLNLTQLFTCSISYRGRCTQRLWFNCRGRTKMRYSLFPRSNSRLFFTLGFYNSLSAAIFIITAPFIWFSWWIFIQIIKFTINRSVRCRVNSCSFSLVFGLFNWHTEMNVNSSRGTEPMRFRDIFV